MPSGVYVEKSSAAVDGRLKYKFVSGYSAGSVKKFQCLEENRDASGLYRNTDIMFFLYFLTRLFVSEYSLFLIFRWSQGKFFLKGD